MTQADALKILKTGANVFLTGEPGSGKTYVVNQYIQYLREHDIEPAITASTGIAATHIGGMTIHSWSGIGIRKKLTEQDLDEMGSNEKLTKRIGRTNVLIIDEISMLDADTLYAVDTACRTIRRRNDAFGGLQIVFVGDFFQLPPVSRRGDTPSEFAFMSESWRDTKPLVCYLTEQHRQEDRSFLNFLTTVRNGAVTADTYEILAEHEKTEDDVSDFTRLYSHNIDVDRINDKKLAELESEEHVYDMEARGSDNHIAQLKRGCLSPESLRLKVGAQVMFTKNNFENGFVNGTLGEVTSFTADNKPVVWTKGGKSIEVEPQEWSIVDGTRTLARIVQHPLRLAWAMTVHKSQGMTLDAAVIDLSEAFEYGQGYVALSRVKAFSGLYLLGYNRRALEVHPKIMAVDERFKQRSMEAEDAFAAMPDNEFQQMERNFILACGGKLQKTKPKVKKVKEIKPKGAKTHDLTLEYWKKEKTIDEIAAMRKLTRGTIISHIEELFMRGFITDKQLSDSVPKSLKEALPEIRDVFNEVGVEKLAPAFEKLGKKHSFEDLRIARLLFYASEQ